MDLNSLKDLPKLCRRSRQRELAAVHLATLAEITGAKVPETGARQVEGISLLPLLRDADATWPDRWLDHHVGR